MKITQEKLAKARVLVVGDVMLDRYWYGAVDRISPEAPVPIVRILREEERHGGHPWRSRFLRWTVGPFSTG